MILYFPLKLTIISCFTIFIFFFLDVVEDAFNSGLQTATDFRDIWLTYLEYLRRRFDVSENQEEEEKRLKELRAAFSKALDFLFQSNFTYSYPFLKLHTSSLLN